MNHKFIEPYIQEYMGDYGEIYALVTKNGFFLATYMVMSIASIWLVNYYSDLMTYTALSIIAQAFLFIICIYVIKKDRMYIRRFPVNWVLTSMLAVLVYTSQTETISTQRGNVIGIILWAYVLYWITLGIIWSIALKSSNDFSGTRELLRFRFIASGIATWGATVQLIFVISWMVIPLMQSLQSDAPALLGLVAILEAVKNRSLYRFFPFSIFLLSMLVVAALRMKDDPYNPKSIEEIHSRPESSMNNFIYAISTPLWIVIVISGFIIHYSKLLWQSFVEFIQYWMARVIVITIGLVIAPCILFAGHIGVLYTFDDLLRYLMQTGPASTVSMVEFIKINFAVLVILCLYLAAIPLMNVRYRGGHIRDAMKEIKNDIFTAGKKPFNALGKSFSLLGVFAITIPAAAILPGGPNYGIFSLGYGAAIALLLVLHFIKSRRAMAKT